MKKSAIVSVVCAGVLMIVGLALMIVTMTSFNYRPFYGGYRMITYGSGAIAGFLLARMVFGAALFIGGTLLLCLSAFLFAGSVKRARGEGKPDVRFHEMPKVEPPKAESVKSGQNDTEKPAN